MCVMFKYLLAVILISSAANALPPLPPPAVLTSQQGLARLFFSSRVTQQDPARAMACFSDYIGDSNQIGEDYGRTYNDCLRAPILKRQQIEIELLEDRNNIINAAAGVCSRLNACNRNNNSIGLFNCHANLGSNNTRATYEISGNASEYARVIQERYRAIELAYEQCLHRAERDYVEATAHSYNVLQACLDGRIKPRPPTTTTSTTTTTTTTTTTPKPTTTPATTTTPASTESPQRIQEQFAQLLNLLN